MLIAAVPLWAHDFEVDGIYYNYISETEKTVSVTQKWITLTLTMVQLFFLNRLLIIRLHIALPQLATVRSMVALA